MNQDTLKEVVFSLLAILALLAFMWLFGPELWSAFGGKPNELLQASAMSEPEPDIDNPRLYVTTAIAALVGGVAAVFLGVQGAKGGFAPSSWRLSDYIRAAYVVVYILFGAAAIVAWVQLGNDTTLAVRNLAVTFIGLVGPAVAGYLRP